MRVSTIAVMLTLLLPSVAAADDCAGCDEPPDTGPLVPIPDPTTWEPADNGLSLLDGSGNALVIDDYHNTLVIGAASWCPGCDVFKQSLGSYSGLDDLRLVFAFGDESYRGGGSIFDPTYLDDLPGEVAYLAPGSVAPTSFPSVTRRAAASAGRPLRLLGIW